MLIISIYQLIEPSHYSDFLSHYINLAKSLYSDFLSHYINLAKSLYSDFLSHYINLAKSLYSDFLSHYINLAKSLKSDVLSHYINLAKSLYSDLLSQTRYDFLWARWVILSSELGRKMVFAIQKANLADIQSSRFRWYSFVFETQSRLVLILMITERQIWCIN